MLVLQISDVVLMLFFMFFLVGRIYELGIEIRSKQEHDPHTGRAFAFPLSVKKALGRADLASGLMRSSIVLFLLTCCFVLMGAIIPAIVTKMFFIAVMCITAHIYTNLLEGLRSL